MMPDKDVARERPARFFVWAGVFEMRQFKVLNTSSISLSVRLKFSNK